MCLDTYHESTLGLVWMWLDSHQSHMLRWIRLEIHVRWVDWSESLTKFHPHPRDQHMWIKVNSIASKQDL